MGEITFRWLASTVGNSFAISILFALAINFAYAPWPLTWNPLYDFLFSRTGGPILYANHISSAFAILGVAAYFMFKDLSRAFQMMMIVFSGVSIHELLLNVVGYPIFIAMNHPTAPAVLDSLQINFRWFFWLSMILIVAAYFANKRQRIKMLELGILLTGIDLIWTVVFLGFLKINPLTIVQYQAGPAFFSLIPNIFEVSSWLISALWWFIP